MAEVQNIKRGPHGHENLLYRGHYRRGCRCEECITAVRAFKRESYRVTLGRDPVRRKEKYERYVNTPGRRELERERGRKRSKLPKEMERCRKKTAARNADRRAFLSKIRIDHGCQDCGYRGHAAALDFDHVADDKKCGGVTRMTCHSMERLTEEIAKTEIVCACCHRVRSRKRGMAYSEKTANPNAMQQRTRRVTAETMQFLAQLKLDRGCFDCGYREHSEALDFDHVRGVKRFGFSGCGCRRRESILEEIAKCEVVCANCHRIRTFERCRK